MVAGIPTLYVPVAYTSSNLPPLLQYTAGTVKQAFRGLQSAPASL